MTVTQGVQQQAIPSDNPSEKATPSHLSQTVLPTGDQAFG